MFFRRLGLWRELPAVLPPVWVRSWLPWFLVGRVRAYIVNRAAFLGQVIPQVKYLGMIKTNRPIPAEQIKLLIFDLDGTLVDSRQDLSNSINAMLRHYGKAELPCDVIASYIGDGAPMLVRRALVIRIAEGATPEHVCTFPPSALRITRA